jgi:formylglycine-generating enzyme required for sulfatase activity
LANFKYNKTNDQLPFTECEVKDTNASTTAGLMLGYESFTVVVNAYNPNTYRLYCMSGNVAEMVIDENNKPATKGGSFSSTGQELQLVDGKDRFKGVTSPNINIGFRPVITIVND